MYCSTSADGAWSDWTSWSACSTTCGRGLKARKRACDNPPPGPGGATCKGLSGDAAYCNLGICPVPATGTNYFVKIFFITQNHF